jgi:hypothetical protein
MSHVHSTDPVFTVCPAQFDSMLELNKYLPAYRGTGWPVAECHSKFIGSESESLIACNNPLILFFFLNSFVR